MKQAILLTAYKNLNHVQHVIDAFSNDFTFYIHIDKKSKLPKTEIEELRKNKKVAFLSMKYKTNWGSLNTLKSILLLSKEALKNNETEYFHLISGGDYPIKNSEYFTSFIEKNKGKEFLENFTLPAKHWKDGGMTRLHHYNFYDLFDAKSLIGSYAIYYTLKFQRLFNVKRKIAATLPPLYGGSTWWSLSKACLIYVVNYAETDTEFITRLKHTWCSEEVYFQTIIMNSPFKNNTVSDNLRFIKWEQKHGSIPAILDEENYPEIEKSNMLFARKFDYPMSLKLREKLEKKG